MLGMNQIYSKIDQTFKKSGGSANIIEESEVVDSESEEAIEAFLRYKRSTIPIIE